MIKLPGRDYSHYQGRHGMRAAAGRRVMPLSMAGTRGAVRVVGLRGGGGLDRKLADMGLTPGAEVRLISCQGAGPVLIDLKGSRLALGRGMAMRIMVEEV